MSTTRENKKIFRAGGRKPTSTAVPATVTEESSSVAKEVAVDMDDEETPLVKSLHANHQHGHHHPPPPKFLSLDFDRVVNSYSTAATRARNESKKVVSPHSAPNTDAVDHPHQKSKESVITDKGFVVSRWVLTILVGLCTGITAVFIIYCVELLVEFRVNRLNREIQWAYHHANPEEIDTYYETTRWFDYAARSFGIAGVYVSYMTYNLILVTTSTLLCLFFAPAAVGSGIPEVMAFLNGVRVGVFDNLQLFGVKLIGTIFSVSSGLVIGPEGPVVHLGAILGAMMTKTGDIEWSIRKFRKKYPRVSRWFGCGAIAAEGGHSDDSLHDEGCECSFISKTIFYLSHFRNDLERRNLISVGAAAGFAAAFGAPVGGLLYSLEEASSFFAHDMLWKTLVGTVVATSCIAIYHGDFTKYSMLSLEIGVQEENLLARFSEVPLYFVIGILGGVLGGCFNNTYEWVNHKRKHFYASFAKRRTLYTVTKVAETAVVSLITSAVMLSVPLYASWACQEAEVSVTEEEAVFMHRYNCPPGYTNELGTILFGSREESIKDILTDPEAFQPATLLTVAFVFLGLMTITFGTAIPSGMFMPTVLTGACLGGYLGMEFQRHLIPSVHPSDFALIGAAAFLSGMQRNVVSLCVILMEGTGQTKVIIPVIITIVCARSVGDFFSEGIYEIGIELKGYPYLGHGEKARYDAFFAKDVMKTEVDSVGLVEPAGAIAFLLRDSDAHAFPVVNAEDGHYRGMVRRDQLIAALECKIYLESFVDGLDGIVHNKAGPSHRELRSQLTFRDESASAYAGAKLKAVAKTGGALLKTYQAHKRESYNTSTEFQSAQLSPNTVTDWNADAPETSSPWLRDNVLTSDDGNEIMFGMDETLPDGSVEAKEKAIVKTEDGKVVVYIPPSEKNLHVDIGVLMNKAALHVSVDYPLSKTYNVFGTLGLRHLPVLTTGGLVAGMITRDELVDEHITEVTGYKLY